MASPFLEQYWAWQEMARACMHVRTIRPKPRSKPIWVARTQREDATGLCKLAHILCNAGKIGVLEFLEIDACIENYGKLNLDRYGEANLYYWPSSKEGWEARRQFCLEQERLCRTHGPLAWRT